MNRLFSTSLKATVVATTLIWVLNAKGHLFNLDNIPYILISIVPIWLVCFTSIILTIVPFSLFEKGKNTNKQVFNTFFPYYSICAFIVSITAFIYSDFNEVAINFFTTTFFTVIASWVWFFKNPKRK